MITYRVPYEPITRLSLEDIPVAHEIMNKLTDLELTILLADHGDGPKLAKDSGISIEALHVRKHRLIKWLRKEYNETA